MEPIVIYHANCADGFCSAWLMSKVYPQAEFFAAHYGTAPPNVVGRKVYIVDFSYKRDVLRQMVQETAGNITVIDHHKTAQEDLTGFELECLSNTGLQPEIIFDVTKAGSRLVFDYLKETLNLSRYEWLVDYVSDRDLWKWGLGYSREISAAIASYPKTFEQWDSLAIMPLLHLKAEGQAILRYQQAHVDSQVKNATRVTIMGLNVPCLNSTTLVSEIGEALSLNEPFSATYFFRQDGKVQWSLRSRPDGEDVSVIALQMGGGGHPRAAGFETSVDTFAKMIKGH